ncbi:hypothetical protein NRIC_35250 [Enterococcus florum]|uniref:Uncharacterized protein n=1 Tax=Enterococcus florum TaxID=2480627 RepID=A0A4P5PFT2_9ENTE|nr:hypothetical protein [Enterococcus florum]GCF95634.1 hypothetical protein NRIC_35250 [Enterococcus florum]
MYLIFLLMAIGFIIYAIQTAKRKKTIRYHQSIAVYEQQRKEMVLCRAKQHVQAESRSYTVDPFAVSIVCPHCWTKQSAKRSTCAGYHCRTSFTNPNIKAVS